MRSLSARLPIALLFCLGLSAVVVGDEIDIRGVTPAGWNALWNEALAKSEGRARPDGPVWVIEVPSERAVYFFTTPLHPAHPSIVRRGRVEGDKGAYIKTTAWTDGAPEPFKVWLQGLLEPKEK